MVKNSAQHGKRQGRRRTSPSQRPGALTDARIRGDLATLRKRGRALLAALETVCAGQPLSPECA